MVTILKIEKCKKESNGLTKKRHTHVSGDGVRTKDDVRNQLGVLHHEHVQEHSSNKGACTKVILSVRHTSTDIVTLKG